MKRVAVVQSNYIPWKGYLDMINMVDEAKAEYAAFDPAACDPEDRAMLVAYVESAFGRKEKALANIREALRQDPKTARTWLAVSDDFHRLAKDPDYLAILEKAGVPK